jgi:hypothetical protein
MDTPPKALPAQERQYCIKRMQKDFVDHSDLARWLRYCCWCRETIGYTPQSAAALIKMEGR